MHEAAQGRGETVLVGSDSAGAVIEVVMETTRFVRARVTDVVLGTAEAEPFAENAGGIEFSVHFPTGARIIYNGLPNYQDKSDILTVSGVWHQVPGGVFGADAGSWKVSRLTEP